MLTAADGEGQQCIAAPACTASTDLEGNGSLEISALTKMKFLKKNTFRNRFQFTIWHSLTKAYAE